uniref:Uncharacterized protein n=1 Tax=Anguilla anguilla TaxID=7936 RepID=A0A0E9TJ88_ANGAN
MLTPTMLWNERSCLQYCKRHWSSLKRTNIIKL